MLNPAARAARKPDYHTPSNDDAARLAAMARRCFVDTFGARYAASDLQAFLEAAYAPSAWRSELADPAIAVRVAAIDDDIIGYAKLTALHAPAATPLPGALELRQLYVLAPWHGSGVADALMDWAVHAARARCAPELYLTVFEENLRARRFYARHGFQDVGGCLFRVGAQVDNDRIWRRTLDA